MTLTLSVCRTARLVIRMKRAKDSFPVDSHLLMHRFSCHLVVMFPFFRTERKRKSIQLEVVVEEEEEEEEEEGDEEEQELGEYLEDEDMFGEIGGIKITFTPP